MGDAALRLLPDFVGCRVVVRLPVGVVRILVGIEVLIRVSRGQLPRHADGAVRSVAGIRINNVGAIALQDLLTLARNIFRHAQRDGKSFRRADHGISDAGVAAGGIEEHLAGTELPATPSLGDNVGGGTILYRSARVIPLSLTQECYARQVSGDRIQSKERSIANAIDETVPQRFTKAGAHFQRLRVIG